MYKKIEQLISTLLIILLFFWITPYTFSANELSNYYQQFSKDTISFSSPTDSLEVNPE